MLLMLLMLLETRLLLDVSSVSRKTWLLSPARDNHLPSYIVLSLHRLLLPCRYSGSGSGSGSAVLTLFYSALLNLPLSRPTDRSEENLLLNTQFSLPLTTITYHLTYSPNSKLVLLLLPAQPTTTTTTTTSTPASAVPCSFPPLFPLCPLCPLYHSSLPLIFPLAHPPVRPQRPPTTPSDHLCQRPQTVA